MNSATQRGSSKDEIVFDRELFALRPWYHDYRSLGFDTLFLDEPVPWSERASRARRFLSRHLPFRRSSALRHEHLHLADVFRRRASSHTLNQKAKEAELLPLAAAGLSRLGPSPSCVDLFCADGYYACQLKLMAPEAEIAGIDRDGAAIRRARTIASKLEIEIAFETGDVVEALERRHFDLVFCAGGLYHLEDPEAFLRRCREACRGVALFQSVTSTANDEASYFETPAPGLDHGSRFSHAWLARCLARVGFEVIDQTRLELPGNRRAEDRGSSYFLCR